MFFGTFTTMLNAVKAARRGDDAPRIARELGAGLPSPGTGAIEVCEERAGTRACPECAAPMARCRCRGEELDKCLACQSYWFDVGELKGITGLFADVPGIDFHSRPSRYRCPDCDVDMVEYVFVNPQNLLVDRCPECFGVYLESGEMRRALDIAEDPAS